MEKRARAVVIGGSMAGLLAADVLADYFETVVVIERDAPADSRPRKGVPQGYHAHLLLMKGAEILQQQFPDLFSELLEEGACNLNIGTRMKWFYKGDWIQPQESALHIYSQSRPLLEALVRKRVFQRSNVEHWLNHEVSHLLTTPNRASVIGVMVRGEKEGELSADLVLDATGRGSKLPEWLRDFGYEPPETTRVEVHVGYATQRYRMPESFQPPYDILAVHPDAPKEKRLGVLMRIEGNQWLLTLSGWHHDYPSHDKKEFLRFAEDLAVPDIYHAIQGATALDDIRVYKYPASQWRHYEKCARLPDGIVPIGDSFCSFNPVYGQGITVAAQSATVLQKWLISRNGEPSTGTRDLRRNLAKVIAIPWLLTTAEDFRYPDTTGKRPVVMPVMHWYTNRIRRLQTRDKKTWKTFTEVLHLLRSPNTLFHPRTVWNVLFMRGEQ